MKTVKGTLNSVQLIGRLGADPEMRFTPTGTAICKFSIATNRFAGRNDNGERTYETNWTKVEVWDRLAEQCNTYLHKGRRVLIAGSLRTETWQDRETGQKRSKTFVRADSVMFLDAPRSDGMDQDMPDESVEAIEEDVEEEVEADIPF